MHLANSMNISIMAKEMNTYSSPSVSITEKLHIIASDSFQKSDLEYLLNIEDPKSMEEIFSFADDVRKKHLGDGIYLRGIIEFSNVCEAQCAYCGINTDNGNIERYSLSKDEILESVRLIHAKNIGTVVLQSGQYSLDSEWFASVIKSIMAEFPDMAITLSVGEKTKEEYELWKSAGADRYLLKIETTNPDLYKTLHPGMDINNRLRCLRELIEIGFQTGCGNLIGLPDQTVSDIASDIIFFAKNNFDMIGIGPFIPHDNTPLASSVPGDVNMVLKTIALTRIITKTANIPATTALGSLEKDFRPEGLKAGANVLMPNFTPLNVKAKYEIYPNKRCITEATGACAACMDGMAGSVGRHVDPGRGDRISSP